MKNAHTYIVWLHKDQKNSPPQPDVRGLSRETAISLMDTWRQALRDTTKERTLRVAQELQTSFETAGLEDQARVITVFPIMGSINVALSLERKDEILALIKSHPGISRIDPDIPLASSRVPKHPFNRRP